MGMKYDPYEYNMPWRPNYEMRCVIVWTVTCLIYLMLAIIGYISTGVMLWFAGLMACFALYYLKPALELYKKQKKLVGFPVTFTTLQEFRKKCETEKGKNNMWLGFGFEWSVPEIQALSQLNTLDVKQLQKMVLRDRQWQHLKKRLSEKDGWKHPIRIYKEIKEKESIISDEIGAPWIHGVGEEEKDIWMKLSHADGHTLIFGTTGSGKTRCFDLLISQAILRGEPVIIIDPKGDVDMEANAREACKALGREDAFVYFHIGHPERSAKINPLSNWGTPDEIASRIAALLPQDSGSAAFTAFCWRAVNNIVSALTLCNISPTLLGLKRYLGDGNMPSLVVQTIAAWIKQRLGQNIAEDIVERFVGTKVNDEEKVSELINWYREKMANDQNDTVNSLIEMYEHDSVHFSKMITSLLPIIDQVVASDLRDLLSPSEENASDKDIFHDMKELIANRNVVYIGLNTLSKSNVGKAVGSLLLADLTAVAGSTYTYGNKNITSPTGKVEGFRESRLPDFSYDGRINVFVDEANEVANAPFIQLLNKGRGAKFRMFVATQTISDFVTQLGDKAHAYQVFGNLNNLIILRCTDPDSQKFICDRLQPTKIKEVQRDQGQNTIADQPILSGDTYRESLKMVETPLVPAAYLGYLPNLEYFGVLSANHVIKGRIPILVRDTNNEETK